MSQSLEGIRQAHEERIGDIQLALTHGDCLGDESPRAGVRVGKAFRTNVERVEREDLSSTKTISLA